VLFGSAQEGTDGTNNDRQQTDDPDDEYYESHDVERAPRAECKIHQNECHGSDHCATN
jgi:hypothetical protein